VTAFAAPTPPPSAPLALCRLELAALPRAARLSLDGVALAGNPYTGALPCDSAPRRVRAEANGYATREVVISAQKDVIVELALTPLSLPGAALPLAAPLAAPRKRR